MASRVFIQGAKYGSDMLYQITVGAWNFTPTEHQVDAYIGALRTAIINELEQFDDRLWWQPETSEIFFEEDESDRELPDESSFDSWWEEMLTRLIGTIELPEL